MWNRRLRKEGKRKPATRFRAVCLLFLFLTGVCGCAKKEYWEYPAEIKAKPAKEEVGKEAGEERNVEARDESTTVIKTDTGKEITKETMGKSREEIEEKAEEEAEKEREKEILSRMTLEEKVAQLFIVEPEQLTGEEAVTRAGEAMKDALAKYPVGGMVYFSGNLQDDEQLKELTRRTQELAAELGMPPLFLSLDEEGGSVARIGNHKNFSVPKVPSMAEIGAGGDVDKAREAGETIGAYLAEYGINLDFAPDADVLTNSENKVIKDRSFGSDPELVGRMAIAYLEGLEANGICGAPKHFPGHGGTKEDSHEKLAYSDKTWEELEEAELVPFRLCVESQVPFIMSGHISLPQITGGDVPCSLSSLALDGYLRKTMGYEGIIITDALGMGAIEKNYSGEEAAVMALEAGADMLLMPKNLPAAYEAVLNAVKQGRISQERLEASVLRIIRVKEEYLSGFPSAGGAAGKNQSRP